MRSKDQKEYVQTEHKIAPIKCKVDTNFKLYKIPKTHNFYLNRFIPKNKRIISKARKIIIIVFPAKKEVSAPVYNGSAFEMSYGYALKILSC